MFSIGRHDKMIEVLSGTERRRRTPQEKIAIVQPTMEPGMTVSHVARLHSVNANQVFTWRRQYQNGSLTAVSAGEEELYRPLNHCCHEANYRASATGGEENHGG